MNLNNAQEFKINNRENFNIISAAIINTSISMHVVYSNRELMYASISKPLYQSCRD